MIISSFFTSNGLPTTGLTPTIKVWKLDVASNTLIVNNDSVEEVGDGFYKYNFTAYDDTKNYTAIVDAGIGMTSWGRYSVAALPSATDALFTIDNTNIQQIVDGVWDATAGDYTSLGTFGLLVNETNADAKQAHINTNTCLTLLDILVKYEHNRTKVDKVAMTLTVYQNDGVTPLTVFDLKDSTGAPSVTEVCERLPRP
jgi:PKD repeat protein